MKQKALHPVGDQIKKARSAAPAISLRELSRRSGVSAGQISRIESGETVQPSPETLRAIAAALGAHPDLLLFLAGHITEDEVTEHIESLATEMVWLSEITDNPLYSGDLGDLREEFGDLRSAAESLFLSSRQVTESVLSMLGGSSGSGATGLKDVASAWPGLTPERRRLVIAFVSDQEVLSRLDRLGGSRGRFEFDVVLHSADAEEEDR